MRPAIAENQRIRWSRQFLKSGLALGVTTQYKKAKQALTKEFKHRERWDQGGWRTMPQRGFYRASSLGETREPHVGLFAPWEAKDKYDFPAEDNPGWDEIELSVQGKIECMNYAETHRLFQKHRGDQ